MTQFILLYMPPRRAWYVHSHKLYDSRMPPCRAWYLHSHKLYDSEDAAHAAARKFLSPETPRAVLPVNTGQPVLR